MRHNDPHVPTVRMPENISTSAPTVIPGAQRGGQELLGRIWAVLRAVQQIEQAASHEHHRDGCKEQRKHL